MYKIKGTNNLFINNKFEIVDNGIGDKKYKLLDNETIEIYIYNHKVVLKLKDLYYIAKTNMYIDNEYIYKNLHLFSFFTREKKNMDVTSTVIIAYLKKPINITYGNSIYRVIPTNTRYAINTAGVILDIIDNKLKFSRSYAEGYPTVRLYNYFDKEAAYTIHRLKAFAWIPNDDWDKKPLVNHIDGDKTNHAINNLEWCTYTYNNMHASAVGLRTDNLFIKIRNVDTGEIHEFPSLTLATEYMQRSRINIQHTDSVGTGKIITTPKGRFELKYKHDTTEWDSVSNFIATKHANQKNKLVIYLDNNTHVCNNNDELISFINTYMDYKMDISLSVDFGRNAEKFKRHYKDIPSDIIKLEDKNKDLAYICLNNTTNEIEKAITRKEIIDITGGNKSSIQKSIISNGAYLVNDIWRIKYDDGKPFAPLAEIFNRSMGIKATYNDIVKTFTSIREASYYFRVDKRTIKSAIKNKTLIMGYYITYNN